MGPRVPEFLGAGKGCGLRLVVLIREWHESPPARFTRRHQQALVPAQDRQQSLSVAGWKTCSAPHVPTLVNEVGEASRKEASRKWTVTKMRRGRASFL